MSDSFIDRHQAILCELVRMSQQAGARSDYVQGGGGNTSAKLDERLMAIKASGFRLDQLELDNAYAVIDYADLSMFYRRTDMKTLNDIEAEGSARAKTATVTVDELPALRPSVEAGFHALLDRYVLHTHAVFANLATCAEDGRSIVGEALADLLEAYGYVPYINPGAQLTFAIAAEQARVLEQVGTLPAAYFLHNHGLVVTGPDADFCLSLHEQINQRVAAYFGVDEHDWPDVGVRPDDWVPDNRYADDGNADDRRLNDRAAEGAPADAESFWLSDTGWLTERLREPDWSIEALENMPLYPDQMVFLGGQIAEMPRGSIRDVLKAGFQPDKAATIFRETGEILYRCRERSALTIEQTLCAVWFIQDTLRRSGREVSAMNAAGKAFIGNWESERYRKSLDARG